MENNDNKQKKIQKEIEQYHSNLYNTTLDQLLHNKKRLIHTLREYFEDVWEEYMIYLDIHTDTYHYIDDDDEVWVESTHTLELHINYITPSFLRLVEGISKHWTCKGDEHKTMVIYIPLHEGKNITYVGEEHDTFKEDSCNV